MPFAYEPGASSFDPGALDRAGSAMDDATALAHDQGRQCSREMRIVLRPPASVSWHQCRLKWRVRRFLHWWQEVALGPAFAAGGPGHAAQVAAFAALPMAI